MVDPKCYVCTHVFADERPVLYMCREAGDQILACGGDDHDQVHDSWRVVHLNHLLERDVTLRVIVELTDGSQAERSSVETPWSFGPLVD
jgi:hypothetical protein